MDHVINFTVTENSTKQAIQTYEREYRNLMFLLKDKLFLDEFGECGGMGRCATCIVRIIGLSGNSIAKERNEPILLSKMGYDDDNIRLSCQLFISNDLDGVEIEIMV